jgi:hypothetical protein
MFNFCWVCNGGHSLVECLREIDRREAKHEETIPHFQRALQLNPDYSKAQKNLKIALSKNETSNVL